MLIVIFDRKVIVIDFKLTHSMPQYNGIFVTIDASDVCKEQQSN